MRSIQKTERATDDSLTCRLRLYVAGEGSNSMQAAANLAAICRSYLACRIETEIVDVFKEPMRALEDGVFMTTTLLKLAPAPARKIVGTLSQMPSVMAALDLGEATA